MRKFLNYIFKAPVFSYSAQVAYYFLLAIFPLIFLMTKATALFSISSDVVLNAIYYLFPQTTYEIIYDNMYTLTAYSNSITIWLYIALAIWSASMLINSLKTILSKPYQNLSRTKNFIVRRGISIVLTLLLVLVLVSSLLAVLIVNVLIGIIAKRINLAIITTLLPIVVSVAIGIVDFVLLYMFIPSRPIKFLQALPGAVFSTIGMAVASSLYSYYINHIADYSRLYGAMGSIIMLVIWLYILSFIIIIGGRINLFYIHIKSNKGEEI